jgi:uncharacterized protein YbjT (DUF2867 family)
MILVTGASGFVGSHFVRRSVREGLPTRALVRRQMPLAGAEVVVGDVTILDTLADAVAGVETVVHAAAITGNLKEPFRGAYDLVNRQGTENLVAAARAAGVRRIVLMSGLGTVNAPAGTYMATRWGMEEAVRTSGIEYVILQPSVLFGDDAEFVAALSGLVRESPVVPVIGPSTLQFQPLWIEDLVTCLLHSTSEGAPVGREVPLGGPDRLTFTEVIQTICDAMGKQRLLVRLPLPLARVQAQVLTALLPKPPLTPAAMELFSFDNVTDPDAVQKAFHFQPRSFREHLMEHGVGG